MHDTARIPEDQQLAVGEVTATQLNQLKERSEAFDLLVAERNRQRRELAQTQRLLALVQNEVNLYVNALLSESPATKPEHTYRVDPDTGTIYLTGNQHTHDDEVDAQAEKEAFAAEAAAMAALNGNPTIDEAAKAALPEPHEYVPNRAPMQSDAQRCIECELGFDEIPGIHTNETQPEPAL
jgi:hypothetical protein